MITAASTLVDVAFAVSTALDRAGITAVLTGGSAATFHAPDALQSDDLDFVVTVHSAGDARGEAALVRLGYARRSDYYVHAASPFPLEFPPGPLMIGSDHVTSWASERRGREVLHVLTATDSCRDRLAAFLFWNDFSGLEQSLAICRARRKDVNIAVVRDWASREGTPHQVALFERRLAQLAVR
jgi:hypothetical protein